jgi:hypothetical protein
MGREFPAFRAEIVDWLFVLSRPAPPPIDQLAGAAFAFDAAHDRRDIGHLDVGARLHIGRALGHFDLDLQIVEILDDRGDVHFEAVIVTHAQLSLAILRRLVVPIMF